MATSLYRLSFTAGFKPLVERLIRRDFDPSAIVDGDDSAIAVRWDGQFRIPAYAQNAALVIDTAECSGLEEAYRQFAAGLRESEPKKELLRVFRDKAFMRGGRAERFVVRGFLRSSPTFPGKEARGSLENAISRLTGARPDSERPDIDLSVTVRDGGGAYFAAVLQGGRSERTPEAGELPRQTARLLCELAGAEAEDVFLDPFAGSGSIPLERARMGPYKMIFASDRDDVSVDRIKARLKEKDFERKRKTIFPKCLDARDLSRFQDGFFTAVVTDPPWGDWEDLDETQLIDLYAFFLKEAERVLSPLGRIVILAGRNDSLDRALSQCGSLLSIAEDLPVLISGKKARAVLLRR